MCFAVLGSGIGDDARDELSPANREALEAIGVQPPEEPRAGGAVS